MILQPTNVPSNNHGSGFGFYYNKHGLQWQSETITIGSRTTTKNLTTAMETVTVTTAVGTYSGGHNNGVKNVTEEWERLKKCQISGGQRRQPLW